MSATPLDTQKLEELYNKISNYEKLVAERLITAYESKEIDYDEMKRLANYLFKRMPKVKNHDDFVAVLEYMSIHNPIFRQILVMESTDNYQQDEKEMIEKLESIISQFK
ncbi:MAG: hypothetical protein N2691_02835 [Patescibacteria group bacterium]|nr:hypothetical protein [Patescibacteria group bacterium]